MATNNKETLKPIGVKGITNNHSINIYQIDTGIEERVLCGINNDKPRWLKLYQTVKGRVYFNLSGTRQYIDEFMRVF